MGNETKWKVLKFVKIDHKYKMDERPLWEKLCSHAAIKKKKKVAGVARMIVPTK